MNKTGNWKDCLSTIASGIIAISSHANTAEAQQKVHPEITQITGDVQEKKHGMEMAQRIIDKRPKGPNDFKKDNNVNPPYTSWVVDELEGDICNAEGTCERTPENVKVNELYKKVQELIRKNRDPLTMFGMVTQKGQKRLSVFEYNSTGWQDPSMIKYGDEWISSGNEKYEDEPLDSYSGLKIKDLDAEKRKQVYGKMITFLQRVKQVLEQPVEDSPRFMVVKTTPETVKYLGAYVHGGMMHTAEYKGPRSSIIPPNTLVKVMRTDAETGYSYLEGVGYVHSRLLEPYDDKTFRSENFGVKRIQVRKDSSNINKNGGLNFRDQNGKKIGKIPAGTELDILALEMDGPSQRALVQYRNPADGRLYSGYLIAREFHGEATRYIYGIE